jgi:hypothetical protein
MSSDEIVQIYPLYFEGVTIKMNEITPSIRRELAQNIYEELHTCGCQHEDRMKTGGTMRSANELARIQSKIKKGNANLNAKQIADKWNKESFGVEKGISDKMTEEQVNKNVDTYRMYLNNLMFENELSEKEHTIYFEAGGELIEWELEDTSRDEDLNWTYWYGKASDNEGKEYPFTFMEMGIDVGGQEQTNYETTWVEKTPSNAKELEKKIEEQFHKLDKSLVSFKDASGFKKGGDMKSAKAGKTESATIQPYIYQGYEYPEQKVWVDAKYKHPDPLKKLMWGYGEKGGKNGTTVSDFNGLFEESGKSVTIKYFVPNRLTANQEKSIRGNAIEKFIQQGADKKSFGGVLIGAVLGVAGTVGYQKLNKEQIEVSEIEVKDLPKKLRFYDPKNYKEIGDRIYEKWDAEKKDWIKTSKKQWDEFFVAGDGEDGRPEYKRKSKSEKMKEARSGEQFVWYLEQSVMKDGGGMGAGGEAKHFVGKFNEQQLKKGEDKIAIKKAQDETGLKYIDSKIIKKKGVTYMEVYLIPDEEYYKSDKFVQGGEAGTVGKKITEGKPSKDFRVFNYTDNIYASPDTYKTKKEAKEFIDGFRKEISERQGYYRDNRQNKIDPNHVDFEIIPSNFSPFSGHYNENGGSMATGGEAGAFEYILAKTVSGEGYSSPEFKLVPTIEQGMSMLRSEKKSMEGDGYLLDEKSASEREKNVVADFNYQTEEEETDYYRHQLIKMPAGKFHLVYYKEPNEVEVTSFDTHAQAKEKMKKALDAVEWQDADEYENYDDGDSFGEHGEDGYIHYEILSSGKNEKPTKKEKLKKKGGRGNPNAKGSKPIHDWTADIDFDKKALSIRKGVWTKKFNLKKGSVGNDGERSYKFKRVKYSYILKFSIDDRNKPIVAIFDEKGTEDRARVGKVSGSVEKYLKAQ